MSIRPSRKWYKKADAYKKKAEDFWQETSLARNFSHGEPIKECPYDFSDKAAQEMFLFESTGKGNIVIDVFSNSLNGYAIGKKWLDVEINRGKSRQ